MTTVTVAEAIKQYNKRNETKYDKVEVQIKKEGVGTRFENFYDVHDIIEKYILCFYGKNHRSGTERYFRIDNASIIRSEA